jgi:hypothetical protein
LHRVVSIFRPEGSQPDFLDNNLKVIRLSRRKNGFAEAALAENAALFVLVHQYQTDNQLFDWLIDVDRTFPNPVKLRSRQGTFFKVRLAIRDKRATLGLTENKVTAGNVFAQQEFSRTRCIAATF